MNNDISSKLEAHVPKAVYSLLVSVGEEAHAAGQNAYIVGGVLRDIFLKRPVTDIDIAVEHDAIKLSKRLSANGALPVREHSRFGTATIVFNSYSIDLASTRTEYYPHPGTLPSIRQGSINEDLQRRDFSINAMAVNITSHRFGELIDPHYGQHDIQNRVIRVLHDRSFADDPTRIFRALRYEQRLRFTLDTNTAALIKSHVHFIDYISGDRIRHEFDHFFQEAEPEAILNRAQDFDILRRIHREMRVSPVTARMFKAARDLNCHSLKHIYWCLLTYPLNRQDSIDIINRLNIPRSIESAIHDTLSLKSNLHYLDTTRITPAEVYAILKEYSIPSIQANAAATENRRIQDRLKSFVAKLRYVKCSINGNDLIKLGIPAGPAIGDILITIRTARLNGIVKTKRNEMQMVYSLFPELRKEQGEHKM